MTAKEFNERLVNLVGQALQENPAPIHQMLVSLETAKTRMANILIQIEDGKAAKEMAMRIVPANGIKIPPISLDN